jgi:protease-4
MGYMVLQELLEGKLGIQPIIVKSGEKKDWPSSFSPPTDEQIQYLQDKLVKPSYERFVGIVGDGREMLTAEDVRRLADGSIYGAQEALDEGLIDSIGYMDTAIERVTELAGAKDVQVVEYAKPFSLSRFLSSESESIFNIDRESLYELNVPQVMYLWTGF